MIHYDLGPFFEMYLDGPWLYGNTVFKCNVIEITNDRVMVIHTILPMNIRFSDKAYELIRCQQNTDGSWYLLVPRL